MNTNQTLTGSSKFAELKEMVFSEENLEFAKDLFGSVKNFFTVSAKPTNAAPTVFPDRVIPLNAISLRAIDEYLQPRPTGTVTTTSVSFDGSLLRQWLQGIDPNAYDEIRLEFAVYTDDMIAAHGVNPDYLDRVTIFIAAYKGHERVKISPTEFMNVYNIGHLNP